MAKQKIKEEEKEGGGKEERKEIKGKCDEKMIAPLPSIAAPTPYPYSHCLLSHFINRVGPVTPLP